MNQKTALDAQNAEKILNPQGIARGK